MQRYLLRLFSIFSVLYVIFVAGGCSSNKFDCSTIEGKAAVIDATHLALTAGNCEEAVSTIEGCYNSEHSDNQVRLARASAQACAAGVSDFLGMSADLVSNRLDAVTGEGSHFWRTATKLFHLTDADTLDDRVEAARLATDALMATIKSGKTISSSYLINEDTDNEGSLRPSDREDDANIFQIYVSTAAIGALQSRYSSPNTSSWTKGREVGYKSTQTDGWEDATKVAGDGCMYAASILNLVDALGEVQPKLSGALQSSLSNVLSLKSALNAACEAGCDGTFPVTGCALASGSCSPCPTSLRNYGSCTGSIADKNSCAAAGIAYLINNDTDFGWLGP